MERKHHVVTCVGVAETLSRLVEEWNLLRFRSLREGYTGSLGSYVFDEPFWYNQVGC